MRRKLYLETFGCQMNVLDSELVLGQLRAQGYESVDDRDQRAKDGRRGHLAQRLLVRLPILHGVIQVPHVQGTG